ncbi:MAG: phage portal protein [Phycisphaerales bacterium JB058]
MASVGGRLDGEARPGAAVGLDPALVDQLIREHSEKCAEYSRLWAYYRNPVTHSPRLGADGLTRPVRRLAQEAGLPGRVTGVRGDALTDDRHAERREVVIENDIAWRVHTMVDFLFGKPPAVVSTAANEGQRDLIDEFVESVWKASGGLALLQDAALIGHVYGHVDRGVRIDERALGAVGRRASRLRESGASIHAMRGLMREAGGAVRIEPVAPERGIPVVDPGDYRRLAGYVIHYEREANEVERTGLVRRLTGRTGRGERGAWGRSRRLESYTEVFTPEGRELWVDGELVEQGGHGYAGGGVPVVHVQNLSQPLRYEGIGEVEPLVPLQDELNTRLSDRASRVTLQSFKMYLAKGIDGFDRVPVSPGTVWSTDNPEASVEAFGGDASSPSEDRHIGEIRQALDKISGVPPVASGVIEARIGNLTSANALRVTMVGLISKTNRKRVTYGRGIVAASEMALAAAGEAGLFELALGDRELKLEWPDPLPIDEQEIAQSARIQRELGVPTDRIAERLGVVPTDLGEVERAQEEQEAV